MSDINSLSLKQRIQRYCAEQLDNKIGAIKENMKEIQQAANSDSKSSMGDKYETSRAMAMIEKENFAKQLDQLLLQKKVLDTINPELECKKVGLGALVETETGILYYMAISQGKVVVGGYNIFTISPVSPIGQAMNNLLPGEKFELNSKTQLIKTVI